MNSPSPEALTGVDFNFVWTVSEDCITNALAYGLNHEAKAATLAIILSQPDVVFTPGSLHAEALERQGKVPAWVPARAAFQRYCDDSLLRSGMVIRAEQPGAAKSVYQASPIEHDELAIAGVILGASLQFPYVSVQPMFGGSQGRASSYRAPELRYHIFKSLVQADRTTASRLTWEDITQHIGEERLAAFGADRMNVYHAVVRMVEGGVLKYNDERTLGAGGRVSFHPNYALAVRSILFSLLDLQDDPHMIAYRTQQALKILGSESSMRKLFAKAKLFSGTAKAGEDGEATERLIMDILLTTGRLTVRQLHEATEEMGRHLAAQTLKNNLGRLAARGQIRRVREGRAQFFEVVGPETPTDKPE